MDFYKPDGLGISLFGLDKQTLIIDHERSLAGGAQIFASLFLRSQLLVAARAVEFLEFPGLLLPCLRLRAGAGRDSLFYHPFADQEHAALALYHGVLLQQCESVPGGGNCQPALISQAAHADAAQISVVIVISALEYQVQIYQAHAGAPVQLRVLRDIYYRGVPHSSDLNGCTVRSRST